MTGGSSYLLDTNVILRFLLNDHAVHSEAAKRLLERAEKREVNLEIPFIALVESVFTLNSFYKRDRKAIAEELIKIVNTPGIALRGPVWALSALEDFGGRKVSLGDACIVAEARQTKISIASFDTDFDDLVGVVRVEPK